MATDPYEVAVLMGQLEQERHRAFLDALTDDMRVYVVESEKLIAEFRHNVQVMFTETFGPLRIDASVWVRDHAVDVGERNAVTTRWRIAFEQRRPI